MLHDLRAVIWKERKSLFRQGGSRAKTLFAVVTPAVMLGIVLPVQFGARWLDEGWSLIAAVLLPLILIGITVPESFAGERERHTLPTLLASRLSDRAILLGKVGFAVAYGWTATLALLLFSAGVANALHWTGRVLLFAPETAVLDVLLSLLLAVFSAALGVLISLRATTAQGAQQALMAVILIPGVLLQLAPVLLLSVVPNGRELLQDFLTQTDFLGAAWSAGGVFAALDVVLLWLAQARFQRSRLILNG